MTQETSKAGIPGPKVLLIGDSGTGKTEAIKTFGECGITPFVIATEQNCLQTLKDMKTPWHYKFISPTPLAKWGQISDMLKKINQLSYENLTRVTDTYKGEHVALMNVLTTCNAFVCDCHGENFGDVSTWKTDRALVLDSLSGLSDMAMGLAVGNKPARSPSDWGVAQNSIRMVLNPLTTQLVCTFVLIAHLAREKDEITGGTNITVNTLGQKLAPDIPRAFSDCIRARREGSKFSWDTADSMSTVVGRHIPISANQLPSFKPLIDEWKKQGGVIGGI